MKINFTRREFFKSAALGSSMLGLDLPAALGKVSKKSNLYSNNIYLSLLDKWCKAMVSLQLNTPQLPGLYGGIMCPACSRIHGRSADAVYPLLCFARISKDEKFVDAAVKLLAWSDHVTRADGSWVNDPFGSTWKGITVFSTIALGEALRHHGDLLQTKVRQIWMERLRKAAEYLYKTFTLETGVINYPMSNCAAMAITGQVLNEPKYTVRAREMARQCLAFFSKENKLIFGEGDPRDRVTPRGCRPVDLGYNVEESLPNLTLYSLITNDKEVLQTVVESMKTHLEFMLPDGAWDNSWGTRSYKWTYWGSRTSDGCQTAYALLAEHDPRFAEAALRNSKLLNDCTHNGILHGGPHYFQHGELPCIHHTFCHAKAVASVIDHKAKLPTSTSILPREIAYGVKKFEEISTWLVATGPWRATLTAYDWDTTNENHPSGGSLSLLWHKAVGPVVAASLNEYGFREANNMQPHRDPINMPLTPRLELNSDNILYRNIVDKKAEVSYEQKKEEIIFNASGHLLDKQLKHPKTGKLPFKVIYNFTPESVVIRLSILSETPTYNIEYILPIISNNSEMVRTLIDGAVEITKPGGRVLIKANIAPSFKTANNQRVFNHVPGLEAIALIYQLKPGNEEFLRIEIS
jgi:hypothetical protein